MMRLRITAALFLGFAPALHAQGNLSVQGLGYPPGQLSTQAKSMGGATGEADPLSPLNPAATGLISTAILMMQAEPEYRKVRIGDVTQSTSISRFPVFVGALPLGSRWAIGVSASTLLDRTWETSTRDSQVVAGETIRHARDQSSDGSIADLRGTVSFALTRWFRVGVGGHRYSGRDVLRTQLTFDDSAFSTDVQQTTISFSGSALSAGAHVLLARKMALGASYRMGGRLNVYEGAKTVGSGFVPDHYGVSAVYLGIAGTAIAVRAAKDDWTRLAGTAPTLTIHEGWDLGAGADVTGPNFGGSPVSLRAGARWRTLPFSADATPVKEQTWGGGFAFPMARGDVQLNMGLLRASRRGSAGVTETAWTLSTGFSIRP
jgi:hypothetical protein